MPNFTLIVPKTDLSPYKKHRFVSINGVKTPTMKSFLEAISKQLDFPEDFEHNLDALDEMLNDLSWIPQRDVTLHIEHFDAFLSQEKKDTRLLELLNLLDATAEDWKWLDDDDDTPPKNLHVLIETCPRAVQLFDNEEIGYNQ
jgi:RNAse (barnase) inhibitor barstar